MLASLPQQHIRRELRRFSLPELITLWHSWRFWARPQQRIPAGDWHTWLILAGRGWGKTRTGAETIKEWVEQGARRIALVAATPADARDVMITGESGLLHIYPPGREPTYQPSLRRLTWPNGAIATVYSAHKHEDKSGLRGPQHDKAWGDEPAKWQYPGNLDQLMLSLRLGDNPQCCLTGTPRSIPMIRKLVKQSQQEHAKVKLTIGSTYDNQANLAASWFDWIIEQYRGTRLGEQELMARLLDDVAGALWNRKMLDACYVHGDLFDDDGRVLPSARGLFEKIVVGVDPMVGDGQAVDVTAEQHGEAGIVVGGRAGGLGYCLEDRSRYGHPSEWAQTAVDAFRDWRADYIVAEQNNGGEMVRLTIQSIPGARDIPVRLVSASRGKYTRAEPVALLHERGKIKHYGAFAALEDQLTTFVPGAKKSPDRLDAYVWTFTELLVDLMTYDMSGGGAYPEETDPKHPLEHEDEPDDPNDYSANGGGQLVDRDVLAQIKRGGIYMP